jgi:hypothetical protein
MPLCGRQRLSDALLDFHDWLHAVVGARGWTPQVRQRAPPGSRHWRPIGEPLTADTFVVPHGLQFPRGAAGIESAVHSVCSDDRDMAAIVW